MKCFINYFLYGLSCVIYEKYRRILLTRFNQTSFMQIFMRYSSNLVFQFDRSKTEAAEVMISWLWVSSMGLFWPISHNSTQHCLSLDPVNFFKLFLQLSPEPLKIVVYVSTGWGGLLAVSKLTFVCKTDGSAPLILFLVFSFYWCNNNFNVTLAGLTHLQFLGS